ncbi:GntR family transcriptional regulator [Leifsonia poae]|uniref:GntR family transcriptional regulator n=1 Tax=Leifsonia poae TaxID=110933 RepID=UPI001CBF8A73|nr:GntR family transcriptional regulator [Leifsonia poae]
MPLPVKDTKPVERQLLRDVVYTRLYDGIIDGTLEPGETLLDEKLTAWLGVSRTPVREALMKLADIGLVEMAPNRYTRVAPIDLRAIDEAIYATGILHEHAARTGIPQLTPAAITRLEKLARDARKHAKSADLPALGADLNAFFHELEEATDNRVLLAVAEGLSPQLLRYVTVWELPFDTADIPGRIAEIAAAAKERDGEKAATLVHELYESARQQFFSEFRRTDAEIDENPIL